MIRQFIFQRWTLFAGLAAGLLANLFIALAVLQWLGVFERARIHWLETKLHAAAAQTGGSLAVATGFIEHGVEGIFVLDFVSGDLTCGVLNPRTGQMAGLFKRNVANDLGVVQGK